VITFKHTFKPLAFAMLTAGLAFSATSYAEVTEPNAKRVKENYPTGTMTEWLQSDAATYALNPVNIRAGVHPDRDDPQGGPYDVIYIFPDAATANAWWDPVAAPDGMPEEIPDDAVALVHWELDNGSGAFPGIMSKADVNGFKSKNCIMSAGLEIPVPGPENPAIEKTCSNPQGSSKRFKMNVLKANEHVDLVYNVEPAPLTYTNYDALPEQDGVEESGRIYRVLQKWHNATGMDSATEKRAGTRIAGFSMELGTGVGDDFTPITGAADDGRAPDKALGFELRPCMADQFFDVSRDRPGTGTNPCSETTDSTGQDLPQEIWLEEEYSTFSPKMYSYNDDKRTTPIGGFWDKQPAGIEPPEVQTMGKLDSGDALSTDAAYDRIDPSGVAADNLPVFYGATTPNYFSIANNQAEGAADGPIDENIFGYLMFHGVLSDESYGDYGDFGILSQGIYIDEDGDPATEGDLIAWWDGTDFRWGSDPDYNGEIEDSNKYTKVPTEALIEFALNPLMEEADTDKYPDTGFPPGPLYEVGIMDDLAGINVDSFVYLGRNFTGDQFTIRLTANSADNVPDTGIGSAVPPWGSADDPISVAPSLDEFVSDDGLITIKALGFAGDPVEVLLADDGVVDLPTVEIENLRTEEVENVTLVQDAEMTWKFSYVLPTAADPVAGSDDDGTLNVWPNDFVRVTYVDAFDGTNTDVVKTAEVQIPSETIDPPPPEDGDDGDTGGSDDDGGGCAAGAGNPSNITMPLLLAMILGYGLIRRRRNEQ
jgi:MYXO-CTERM domain-containing protein